VTKDVIREKEKMLAGIRKWVVLVRWYDLDRKYLVNTVFVEAEDSVQAKKAAADHVWEEIKSVYMIDADDDENVDRDKFDIWAETPPKAVDELEYPSVL